MLPDPTKDCSAEQLASLFDLLIHSKPMWSDDEMADLLQAQWSSPVALFRDDNKDKTSVASDELLSIGKVLENQSPDIEQLIAIKQFARQCLIHPDQPLPEKICHVLYLCSIAVAWVRCQQSLSTLSPSEIHDRIQSILTESWLTFSVRSILENASAVLEGQQSLDKNGDTTA